MYKQLLRIARRSTLGVSCGRHNDFIAADSSESSASNEVGTFGSHAIFCTRLLK